MLHDTPPGFRLMPGMPLTADVKVGTRSVLADPITKDPSGRLQQHARANGMRRLDVIARQIGGLASVLTKAARELAARLPVEALESATALLFAAAGEGDAGAAYEVGERYLEGNGVVKNAVWAARWYARAAEAGHVPAQCRLAALHLSGVPRAAVEADAGLFDTADGDGPIMPRP